MHLGGLSAELNGARGQGSKLPALLAMETQSPRLQPQGSKRRISVKAGLGIQGKQRPALTEMWFQGFVKGILGVVSRLLKGNG